MSYHSDLIDQICIAADTPISEVVAIIDRTALGLALVVDEVGRLRRTVTDGDIRRAMIAQTPFTGPISALPPGPADGPLTAPAGTLRHDLLHLMHDRRLRHVPLVNANGRVVDLVVLNDLMDETEPPFQAVLMAGGFGTRLRPLTETLPKPMLQVGDRPIIEHIVNQMRDCGIRRIDVTTHYLAEQIKSHLGDGQDFGVDISYVNELKPLGTAGALSLIERPNKTTLVMNGDVLTRIDFRAMYDFHRDRSADLTVALCPYSIKVPYGVAAFQGDYLTAIQEKPTFNYMINAGIYLLEGSVFEFIPRGRRFDMPSVIDALLAEKRSVAAFPIREYWLDIGQPDDYLRAQEDARFGKLA